jgi:hypothetical protein
MKYLIALIALIPSPALAESIPIPGGTNDGANLTLITPVTKEGSTTYFTYEIDYGGEGATRNAATPYCAGGEVQERQSYGKLRSPGWVARVGDELVNVTADSPASRGLLKAVCAMVE